MNEQYLSEAREIGAEVAREYFRRLANVLVLECRLPAEAAANVAAAAFREAVENTKEVSRQTAG